MARPLKPGILGAVTIQTRTKSRENGVDSVSQSWPRLQD